MDLRQLGYVVAVVDEGTFTAAAAAEGVTQPSLSQAVRALEVELGAELFSRGPGGARLTAAGEALVGPARQALRDAAVARAAVADVVGLRAGRLDLVCLPSLAVEPTAALIGRFRRRHPDVVVRLHEPEDAAAVAEQVRTGECEIGLTELPAADDLVEEALEAHDYVAVLPPPAPGDSSGPRAATGPLSVRDLARRPLVTTPPGTSTRRVVDDALAAVGATATIAVETDHREAVVPLVVAGAGVALMPQRLARGAVAQGAVVRAVTPPVGRTIGLIHRAGTLSPAAAAFLALAVPGAPSAAPRSSRPRARRRRSG